MGKTNRATAITDMNEHSSRSHALLCVTVIGTNKTTGQRTTGKTGFESRSGLNFSDLSLAAAQIALKTARIINISRVGFFPQENSILWILLAPREFQRVDLKVLE